MGGGGRKRGAGGWWVEGEGGRCEHKSSHFFYTRHTVITSSTEPYSLVKIFPMVFKIEGIVALTIKGR